MGFDYQDKIDEYLSREKTLKQELQIRSDQIISLKEVITGYKKLIETQKVHMNDAKILKEMQWRNIIDYDLVKNAQKSKMSKTIKEEVASNKNMLRKLYK